MSGSAGIDGKLSLAEILAVGIGGMIGAGISPPPASVTDMSVDLKGLLAAHAPAG